MKYHFLCSCLGKYILIFSITAMTLFAEEKNSMRNMQLVENEGSCVLDIPSVEKLSRLLWSPSPSEVRSYEIVKDVRKIICAEERRQLNLATVLQENKITNLVAIIDVAGGFSVIWKSYIISDKQIVSVQWSTIGNNNVKGMQLPLSDNHLGQIAEILQGLRFYRGWEGATLAKDRMCLFVTLYDGKKIGNVFACDSVSATSYFESEEMRSLGKMMQLIRRDD